MEVHCSLHQNTVLPAMPVFEQFDVYWLVLRNLSVFLLSWRIWMGRLYRWKVMQQAEGNPGTAASQGLAQRELAVPLPRIVKL